MTKKLEVIRAQIAEITAQLSDPSLVSPSRAEVEHSLRAQFETLAASGADIVSASVHQVARGGLFDPLFEAAAGFVDPLAAVNAQGENVTALIACLFGPEVLLAKVAHFLADLPDAPDAETRAQRTADLKRELAALEADEEAAIRQIEAAGGDWTARPGQRAELAILED